MPDWLIALIPALPLAAALWIGLAILFGQASGEAHEPRTSGIALTTSAGAFAATLILIVARLTGTWPDQITLSGWLVSGDYRVDLNFLTDGLSLALLTVTTLASLLITRFAVNYLHREAGFHRFFMILSLFTAAMTLLVSGRQRRVDLHRLGSRRTLLLPAHRLFPGSPGRRRQCHPRLCHQPGRRRRFSVGHRPGVSLAGERGLADRERRRGGFKRDPGRNPGRLLPAGGGRQIRPGSPGPVAGSSHGRTDPIERPVLRHGHDSRRRLSGPAPATAVRAVARRDGDHGGDRTGDRPIRLPERINPDRY